MKHLVDGFEEVAVMRFRMVCRKVLSSWAKIDTIMSS